MADSFGDLFDDFFPAFLPIFSNFFVEFCALFTELGFFVEFYAAFVDLSEPVQFLQKMGVFVILTVFALNTLTSEGVRLPNYIPTLQVNPARRNDIIKAIFV